MPEVSNTFMEKCVFITAVCECSVYRDVWKPLIREKLVVEGGV